MLLHRQLASHGIDCAVVAPSVAIARELAGHVWNALLAVTPARA
jgi:hypothetical protein